MANPTKPWDNQHTTASSVLRRSTPLKQSAYVDPKLSSASNRTVCCMSAATSWLSTEPSDKRSRAATAWLIRPLRTSHQGECGAKRMMINNGTGNIHWRAKGIRQPHWVVFPTRPSSTPAPIICPITIKLSIVFFDMDAKLVLTPAQIDKGGTIVSESERSCFDGVGSYHGSVNYHADQTKPTSNCITISDYQMGWKPR